MDTCVVALQKFQPNSVFVAVAATLNRLNKVAHLLHCSREEVDLEMIEISPNHLKLTRMKPEERFAEKISAFRHSRHSLLTNSLVHNSAKRFICTNVC